MPSIWVAPKWQSNIIRKWKCHVGANYMPGMIVDPPFYFWIFKGDLTMEVYEMFDVIITEVYF